MLTLMRCVHRPLAQRAMGAPPQRAAGQPTQAAPAHAQALKSARRGAAADALTTGLPAEELLAERLASIDPQVLQALQQHLSGQALAHGNSSLHRPDSRTAEDAEDRRQRSCDDESSTEGSTMGASPAGMQSGGGNTTEGSIGAASRQTWNAAAAKGGGALAGVRGEGDGGFEQFEPGSEAVGGDAPRALPVSAVAMGLAPERSGEGTPCGSDIAEDALLEEEVAHMAQRFFQQQQPPPNS